MDGYVARNGNFHSIGRCSATSPFCLLAGDSISQARLTAGSTGLNAVVGLMTISVCTNTRSHDDELCLAIVHEIHRGVLSQYVKAEFISYEVA